MKQLARIWTYLQHFKKEAALNVFYNIWAVLFSLVSLTMVIPFLSLLFDKQKLELQKPNFSWSPNYVIDQFNYTLSSIIVDRGKVEALLFVCLIVIVVFFLKNAFRYLALYHMATIRNGVVKDLRQSVFDKLLSLPLPWFSEKRKGDLLTRVTSDVQEVEWGIMSVLEVAVKEPLTVFTYLLSMCFISPLLTLFVLLVLPLSGLVIGKVGKSLKKKSLDAQNQLGSLTGLVEENLSGLRVVKAMNAEEQMRQRFASENNAHFELMRSMLRRRDLSSPLSEFLSIGVVALVLYIGGRMVLSDSLDLEAETFIAFMVIFSQILSPAKAFSNAFYLIQKGLASLERIEFILHEDSEPEDKQTAQKISDLKNGIRFENINFSYQENQKTLQNINLEIKKGQTVAFVGPSGAGKSSLLDLLLRFNIPQSGRILIDNIDILDLKRKELHSLFGMVNQEPILFNDSVKNNIKLGVLSKVEANQIEAASRVAFAHNFVMEMEQAYETKIGDRGSRLSGGERQRLTIARALFSNPPVLLLDEATSALDSQSEKQVQEALANAMKGRTVLVVAHRLSTIKNADLIVLMEKGKIVSKGTHSELLNQSALYRSMVELQAFSA